MKAPIFLVFLISSATILQGMDNKTTTSRKRSASDSGGRSDISSTNKRPSHAEQPQQSNHVYMPPPPVINPATHPSLRDEAPFPLQPAPVFQSNVQTEENILRDQKNFENMFDCITWHKVERAIAAETIKFLIGYSARAASAMTRESSKGAANIDAINAIGRVQTCIQHHMNSTQHTIQQSRISTAHVRSLLPGIQPTRAVNAYQNAFTEIFERTSRPATERR